MKKIPKILITLAIIIHKAVITPKPTTQNTFYKIELE